MIERFTCPKCGRSSSHPDDRSEGYCGACHEFTGKPTPEGMTRSECPNGLPHTVMPSGYVEYLERAAELDLTHVNRQCPGCGAWAIWERRL